MKIKCIAIDDEPFALKIIEDFCKNIPFIELVKTFNSSYEGFIYLKTNKPDLIFLDIKMPEISGIQIAENTENLPPVIFTTAHSKYAINSYNLDAIDYLLKPFDLERFIKAVNKARKYIEIEKKNTLNQELQEAIIIRVEYKNIKVYLSEILYIESMDNYIKIHTSGKYHLTQQSLKSIFSLLSKSNFCRVHKSYIVSISKINHFTRTELTIGDVIIPIGRVYSSNFIECMNKYI